MICQSPKCNDLVPDAVLRMQPNVKTCGKEECQKEYRRLVWRNNAKRYRQRRSQKGGA